MQLKRQGETLFKRRTRTKRGNSINRPERRCARSKLRKGASSTPKHEESKKKGRNNTLAHSSYRRSGGREACNPVEFQIHHQEEAWRRGGQRRGRLTDSAFACKGPMRPQQRSGQPAEQRRRTPPRANSKPQQGARARVSDVGAERGARELLRERPRRTAEGAERCKEAKSRDKANGLTYRPCHYRWMSWTESITTLHR